MQIQLKQNEIVSALKQYITSQGINLNQRTVDISFTASRGAAGLVADITIEEVVTQAATEVLYITELKAQSSDTAIQTDNVALSETPAVTEETENTPKTTSLFA